MFPARRSYVVQLGDHPDLRLGERPLVMGIINVTPDSFAEASPTLDPASAIAHALQMEHEGADILDVGGESTRPGTDPVTAGEELARVLPVLKGLVGRVRVPISVDTYHAEVARTAIAEGAAIINDISGLQYDPRLAGVVADSSVALVLVHMRGRPKLMYTEATYQHLVAEVSAELKTSMRAAAAAGVDPSRLIVDPGTGFAKRPSDSYGVLAQLPAFAAAFDRPVLVGPSRKSFMREALDGRAAPQRDWGTAAAVTAAVLAGVHIVRVHAVGDMVQVVKVAEEIRRHAE